MADITSTLRILMSASTGNTLNAFNSVARAISGGPVAALGALTLAGAGLAISLGTQAVQAFGDYQQRLNSVRALNDLTTQQTEQYSTALKKLAIDAGVAPTQLTDGLNSVLGASYRGADAVKVLTLATEDAKIGMTKASITTDSLTNVLRSFSVQSKDITATNGQMLETVTLGKSTFEQYAQSIVKSASSAVQFHVSMQTMNAAWATMTSSGIRAAQASTDFQQSLKVMYGNVDTVAKSLNKAGIAFNENKFNAASYGDKVIMLNKALDEANTKHIKVTGVTIQAAQAISTIANHIKDYNSDLATLSDKQAMAKKTQDAWAITQSGFKQQMDRLNAASQVFMINLGQKLVPILTQVAANVAPIITNFTNWTEQNHIVDKALAGVEAGVKFAGMAIQTTIDAVHNITMAAQAAAHWFQVWHDPIINTGIALGVYFTPLLIKTGIESTIAGYKIAANFIASVVQTGVASVVNAAKVTYSFVASMIQAGGEAWIAGPKIIAGFVASIVTTGTAAVVNAAKVTASFIATMAKTAAQAIATGAIVTARFVWSLIVAGAQAIATGTTFLASLIPAIISVAVEATVAAATAIPGLVIGFIAWATTAGAAAIATIAATWPILLIIAAIALLVVGIILLVTHWSQVTKFMQGVWTSFTAWLFASLHSVAQFFTTIWNGIIKFFQAAWVVLKVIAMVAMATLLVVILGPLGILIVLIATHWNHAQQIIKTALDNIISFFRNLPGQMLRFGSDMINGFINGIRGAVSGLYSVVGNIADWIHAHLHFSVPDTGPLADAHKWMPDMMQLFTSGIQDNAPKLQAAINASVVAPVASIGPKGSAHPSSPLQGPSSRAVVAGGGHTFIINVSTMARSQSEVSRMVDMIEAEMGKRFRGQTSSYNAGGIF